MSFVVEDRTSVHYAACAKFRQAVKPLGMERNIVCSLKGSKKTSWEHRLDLKDGENLAG